MKLIEASLAQIWRLWSVKLAMLAGIIGGYFAAYPAELAKLVGAVPEQYRPVASVLLGLLIFATATGTRIVAQKPKDAGDA